MRQIIFILIFITLITPTHNFAVVTYDGDVITGNTLPAWGVLCADTIARGSPHEAGQALYPIAKGQRVRLYDQSRPTGEWVMIGSAAWIRIDTLCR